MDPNTKSLPYCLLCIHCYANHMIQTQTAFPTVCSAYIAMPTIWSKHKEPSLLFAVHTLLCQPYGSKHKEPSLLLAVHTLLCQPYGSKHKQPSLLFAVHTLLCQPYDPNTKSPPYCLQCIHCYANHMIQTQTAFPTVCSAYIAMPTIWSKHKEPSLLFAVHTLLCQPYDPNTKSLPYCLQCIHCYANHMIQTQRAFPTVCCAYIAMPTIWSKHKEPSLLFAVHTLLCQPYDPNTNGLPYCLQCIHCYANHMIQTQRAFPTVCSAYITMPTIWSKHKEPSLLFAVHTLLCQPYGSKHKQPSLLFAVHTLLCQPYNLTNYIVSRLRGLSQTSLRKWQ